MSAEGLKIVCGVLVTAVPTLYATRTNDQRPLRGAWLLVIAAVFVIAPAIEWHEALSVGFTRSVLRHAVAITIPLAQFSLLLASVRVFKSLVGGPPGRFTLHGHGQSNVDTLMRGFVLFVIGVGGAALCANFQH